MATAVLKPEPSSFPPGTKVKVFPRSLTPWSQSGQPPGTEQGEYTVGNDGVLTVTSVTAGKGYVGWSQRSSVDYYLSFFVPEPAASSGTSVAEVEALIASLAVSSASPAFTGVPTAPTAAPGTNTTQLATTAFAAAIAALKANIASPTFTGVPAAPTAAPATNTTQIATTAYADAIAALKANLASPTFTGTPAAPTAAADTNTTQLATTAYAKKEADDAQAAAELASALRLAVHASVTTNGTTATVNQFHPVNDEAESRTIKLPTGQVAGSIIGIEKSSSTAAREVSIEGNMRGEAAQTIKLRLGKQTVFFMADAAGSWWPLSMYVPLATLTTDYIQRTIAIPAGQVPGNEQLAAWEIHLFGTEKRTLVRARIRTVSGTIKVAIKRGEEGTTEIVAYKELKGAETQEVVESEQALSDKDRITVTASGGSSPKGLFIDIWEKVEK